MSQLSVPPPVPLTLLFLVVQNVVGDAQNDRVKGLARLLCLLLSMRQMPTCWLFFLLRGFCESSRDNSLYQEGTLNITYSPTLRLNV